MNLSPTFHIGFRHILTLLIMASGLFISSCSSSGVATDQNTSAGSGNVPSGPIEIDLFSARGFLGGSDYERYFLKDQVLWRECGSVERSKEPGKNAPKLEGDSLLKRDPQLRIRERRVEKLTATQGQIIAIAARDFLNSLASTKISPPTPGSVFSLADPGLLELSVSYLKRKERLITSVDSVADGETKLLGAAHRLFALLRGVGPTICNAQTFFGIERRAE